MSGTSVTSGAVERTTSVWRRARARKLPPTEIRNPEGSSNPTRVGNRVKDHRRRASGRTSGTWNERPLGPGRHQRRLLIFTHCLRAALRTSGRRSAFAVVGAAVRRSNRTLPGLSPSHAARGARAKLKYLPGSRRVALRHVSDFATSRGGLGRTSSSSSSVSRAGNEWRRARERAVRYPALNWLLCLVNRNS